VAEFAGVSTANFVKMPKQNELMDKAEDVADQVSFICLRFTW
jgi:hypothetical protein